MTDLNNLNGLTLGDSVSGAAFGRIRFGVVNSSGKWGGTFSIGVGIGAHASADAGITIGLKVFTWEQIAKAVKTGTEEGQEIASIFGINKTNIDNTIKIIKDFYRETSKNVIDK